MIGNRVTVHLREPEETIAGELRKQNHSGLWVYHGWAEQAAVRFYPMYRVTRMEDNGYVHR